MRGEPRLATTERDAPAARAPTRPEFPGNPLSVRGWQAVRVRFGLTRRELDVAVALHDGLSEDSIARRLGISARTVHVHLGNLFRKFGVGGRAALILHLFSWHVHVFLPLTGEPPDSAV
jgi:DNA-binding CsgD family transcriptional regulator